MLFLRDLDRFATSGCLLLQGSDDEIDFGMGIRAGADDRVMLGGGPISKKHGGTSVDTLLKFGSQTRQ